MERARLAQRFLAVLTTALVVLLCVEVALPIVSNTGEPPAEVTDLGNNQWEVRNRNYRTLQTTEEEFGGVGLEVGGTDAGVSVVSSVDTADLVLAGSSMSVGYSFATNATVAAGFNATTAGTWTGFLGQSPGTMVNVDVDLVYTLTTMSGTTFSQLQTELLAGHVGTDEANSNGTLTGNSLLIFNPASVSLGGRGPAMGDTWLLFLGVLTIAVGLLALRRARDRRLAGEAR